jgi:hypothetical protein
MVAHTIWNVTFALVVLTALVRGGRPEKSTAIVLLVADIISALPLRGIHWQHVEPSLWIIDFCVAVFFIGLALNSRRWWPLWAAAFHLLAVIMLAVNALEPAVRPYAYYVGELIWDYLGLMAFLLGVLIEGRRDVAAPPFQASSSPSAR